MSALPHRIPEIDYLKCLFILLMVAFHLVYIGDTYPYAKRIVYTFHMSGFLLLSGYLLNIDKPLRGFLRKFLWIFIPYTVMEVGYVGMSAILPVREAVDALSLPLLLDKVFLHPMGPYWYLHTLMLCGTLSYVVLRLSFVNLNFSDVNLNFSNTNLTLSRTEWRKSDVGLILRFLILLGLFYILSRWGGVVNFSNAGYFLFGLLLARTGEKFTDYFVKRLWVVIPLTLLFFFPRNLDRGSAGGILIVLLVIGFLLATYKYVPARIQKFASLIGRNTLIILLFSPIFTMLSKLLLPYLLIEPTGMLFMFVATSLTVAGSFGVAWLMDRTGISCWFFGKARVLN